MRFDYSTINIARLKRKFKVYKMPATFHLQDGCGNACYMDPPGHPSYFTRCVYTGSGNTPHGKSVQMVISTPWTTYALWDGTVDYDKHAAILDSIWLKLPLEHPRTQAWIRNVFAHMRHCYKVPADAVPEGAKDRDTDLIWPGGCLGGTPFGNIRDVEHEVAEARKHRDFDKWTEEHKQVFVRGLELDNDRVNCLCARHATPDNHRGTIMVREYYPEFEPTDGLMNAEYTRKGDWWERYARCPTADDCPGMHGRKHPANGEWCQLCGWRAQ